MREPRARHAAPLLAALVLLVALSGCGARRAADLADVGQQALVQGDHRAAIAAFERALKLDPQADYYLGLGLAYDLQGNADLALLNLGQAIALDPTNAEAFYRRGNVLGSLGDYGSALSDLAQALALDPTHARAYLSRASLLIELGNPGRARADLFRALAYAREPELRAQIEMALRATEPR
ncbi:MAG: tetratricopeptide repeat protein [Anaerolineales bacterium]